MEPLHCFGAAAAIELLNIMQKTFLQLDLLKIK